MNKYTLMLLLCVLFLHNNTKANQKPIANFTLSHESGLVTDTFRFINLTTNNATSYSWSFSPSSVIFVNNTNANSINPQVIFFTIGKINVRLIATNQFGSDTILKTELIQTHDYTNPYSIQGVNLTNGNISILRVRLLPGIDTTLSNFNQDYIRIGGNQRATLLRGRKNGITVFRINNTTPVEFRVWIDFNRNGQFDNNELVLNKSNVMQDFVTDSFFIPDNQPLRYTRMRVLVALNHPVLNSTFAQMGVYRDFNIGFGSDTVKPSIFLNSSNILYSQINTSFFDPMATAFDNIEGNISHKVQRTGIIDTSAIGNYTLRYFVTDLYGNTSDTLTRQVFITLNQLAPTLNLLGDSFITMQINTKFIEPGYTAFDNSNTNITQFVVVSGNLDTSNVGFYTILYSVTDAFNRTTVARRFVRVVDTQKPIITPIRSNPHIHAVFKPIDIFSLVNVTDNSLKPMLPLAFGFVNTQLLGNYTVIYKAFDQSNNEADSLVLTVSVVDTVKPTLRDTNLILNRTIEVFTTFNLQIPVFDDNYWASNTLRITQTGNVNTNRLGTYLVTFTCEDPSGNKATVTFTIRVVDTTKPIINIFGNPVKGIALNVPVKPDTPITLFDNYDSEAFLFNTLIVTYPVPLNTNGELLISTPGLYAITYQCKDSSNNFSNLASYSFNIVGSNSINKKNDAENVKVYPNPASGFLWVEPKLNKPIEVVLIDMLGKIVLKKTVTLYDYKINIDSINNGIYILIAESEEGSFVQKVVVEK